MRASELSADERELLEAAREAREHAWAPVSNYQVGAAVRTADGSVYTGCNVENIILALSSCAELVAIQKAVSEGHRVFTDVAVVTDDGASPCGSCRQLLSYWSFGRAIVGDEAESVDILALDELLPRAFALKEPRR